jgi:hypothetical protein
MGKSSMERGLPLQGGRPDLFMTSLFCNIELRLSLRILFLLGFPLCPRGSPLYILGVVYSFL